MEINLTLVAAIWMGGLLLLVPLLGLVARFGIVPVLDAVARLRRAGEGEEATARLERLERSVAALLELLETNAVDARPAGRGGDRAA
jgi:hypothetical protein